MLLRTYLLSTVALSLIALPVQAQEAENSLKPRIEGNIRAGNDRTIGMTEVWIPVIQNEAEGSVLYTDFRLMDDNQDNNEGNIALGYRKIITGTPLGDGIAGAHIWYDRRHTDLGTNFNQITAGAEWFGDEWDVKANAYFPLNDQKTYAGALTTSGGFLGTQIVALSDQTLFTEEALKGFDIELGWRIPALDNFTDSTRIYGGGYHFSGDEANDVTGYRTRIASDITEDLQIGARFQHDDERGSQAFLEATIRFPFGNKQSYKAKGIRARLDESPERDIDIVSGQATSTTRTTTSLTNADTATTQEIFHVNNTAAGGGNGSFETPFNTLAAAVAAAGTNDVIYVHRGDGTTTGQNAGAVINDAGQKLIGAGVNLTPLLLNLEVLEGIGLTSETTLIEASTAPVITNTGGTGVTVTADNVVVSGVTVSNATSMGIRFNNSSGTAWNSAKITNVTTNSNGSYGINIYANSAGSDINNLTISDSTTNNNASSAGVLIDTYDAAIAAATISNVTANDNDQRGFYIFSLGTSSINNLSISNFSATNTGGGGGQEGFFVWAQDDSSVSFSVADSTITGNAAEGVRLLDGSTGAITADFGGGTLGSAGNNSIFGNTGVDVRVDLDGGTLKAENNWWGVNTGLAGGETTLDAGSGVDATPFLTSAP